MDADEFAGQAVGLHGRLARVAYLVCGDRELAEECAQEVLGISAGAVKNALFHARKALAQTLGVPADGPADAVGGPEHPPGTNVGEGAHITPTGPTSPKEQQ